MGGDAEIREKQSRKNREKKKERKKETIEKPCGKALVPPQEINITILLSCFADIETQGGRN